MRQLPRLAARFSVPVAVFEMYKLKFGKLFGHSKRRADYSFIERLDDLSLSHITSFLDPEDIVRLGRTSRRMYSLMPRVILTTEEWKGEDLSPRFL